MMFAKDFEYYTIILRGAFFSWTRCRHGPKSWGIGESQKPKQLQGTNIGVKWPVIASLIITLDDKR